MIISPGLFSCNVLILNEEALAYAGISGKLSFVGGGGSGVGGG